MGLTKDSEIRAAVTEQFVAQIFVAEPKRMDFYGNYGYTER